MKARVNQAPENRDKSSRLKDTNKRAKDKQDKAESISQPVLSDTPAGIEYMGVSGSSKDCQDAILRLIQYGDRITHARILSCCPHGSVREHSFLLTINVGDPVAIRSGFASGYGGTGPRAFSYVLEVLNRHGAEIDEIDVSPDLFGRLEYSALTREDLETIQVARPHRPSRWPDYVDEKDFEQAREGTLWSYGFPPVVPFAIVDSRIVDLALSFWNGPDEKLLAGYRRLEDIVRQRTGIDQHGSKLFSQAYRPTDLARRGRGRACRKNDSLHGSLPSASKPSGTSRAKRRQRRRTLGIHALKPSVPPRKRIGGKGSLTLSRAGSNYAQANSPYRIAMLRRSLW